MKLKHLWLAASALLFVIGCGDDSSSLPIIDLSGISATSLDLANNFQSDRGQCQSYATQYSNADQQTCLQIFDQSYCQARLNYNVQKADLDFVTAYNIARANLDACNAYNMDLFRADCVAEFNNQIAWALSDCAKIHI